MKRKRTLWELFSLRRLRVEHIKQLFDLSTEEANIAFRFALELDIKNAGGKDRLVSTDKVTMESACIATGVTYEMLEKQIKIADALAQQSAKTT